MLYYPLAWLKNRDIIETRYSDGQPRDDRGRWIDSGGGDSSSVGGNGERTMQNLANKYGFTVERL